MPIIDFRVRPPLGGYLDMLMYTNAPRRDRATSLHDFTSAESASAQSIDLLINEMDRAGITTGVMVGRVSAAFGSVSNADLKQIESDYPGRFIGIPSIDPTQRKPAEAQIDKILKDGHSIVGMEPTVVAQPMHFDDRRLYPIYAKLEDAGLTLIMMAGGNAGPDLSYTDPCHIDRVLADFPTLKIVATHGAWPWVHQILHVAYRRPNLFLSPDQYMANMPGMDDYIRAADGFLADRLLYASSYPFLPLDKYADWFRTLPIRPENMKKVMYTNAARLLGI